MHRSTFIAWSPARNFVSVDCRESMDVWRCHVVVLCGCIRELKWRSVCERCVTGRLSSPVEALEAVVGAMHCGLWTIALIGIKHSQRDSIQRCSLHVESSFVCRLLHRKRTRATGLLRNMHLDRDSFSPQPVLRQVYSSFQTEFSTDCDPVLPLSISFL